MWRGSANMRASMKRATQPASATPTSRRSRQPIQRMLELVSGSRPSSSCESKLDSGPIAGPKVERRAAVDASGREAGAAESMRYLWAVCDVASDEALLAREHRGFGAARHVEL